MNLEATFVIVGTDITFKIECTFNLDIKSFWYMGVEYDCKLHSRNHNEVLYHLTKKVEKITQIISDDVLKDWDKYEHGPFDTRFAPDCKITFSPSMLKQQLDAAIQSENYELAAELRDKLSKI